MNNKKRDVLTVIYILGSGHSGSTLLDLILGSHSQIWGCGELQQLPRYVRSEQLTCGCGAPLPSCTFWSAVLEDFQSRSGIEPIRLDLNCPSWRKLFRLPSTERQRLAQQYSAVNYTLFQSIASVCGKRIIVDSSKQAQRLYFLSFHPQLAFKVIHLVRDGRAVVNSFIRKYGRSYRWQAIYRWASPNLMAFWLRRRFHRDNWMQVRYERLARFPEETLRDICRFIGIAYEPTMLQFTKQIHHNIDGNLKVLRSRNSEIRLDQRWKRELHPLDRWAFELVAGWLNALYGGEEGKR